MPEYFLVVDSSDAAEAAAQVLRAAWPRVDVATSTDAACARIAELHERGDDLVVIVDADLFDQAVELKCALGSRSNTIVMTATDSTTADSRTATERFVVAKPYGNALVDQTEEAVSHLRMNRVLVHVVSILITETQSGPTQLDRRHRWDEWLSDVRRWVPREASAQRRAQRRW